MVIVLKPLCVFCCYCQKIVSGRVYTCFGKQNILNNTDLCIEFFSINHVYKTQQIMPGMQNWMVFTVYFLHQPQGKQAINFNCYSYQSVLTFKVISFKNIVSTQKICFHSESNQTCRKLLRLFLNLGNVRHVTSMNGLIT